MSRSPGAGDLVELAGSRQALELGKALFGYLGAPRKGQDDFIPRRGRLPPRQLRCQQPVCPG